MKTPLIYVALIAQVALLCACSSTRMVSDEQYLLNKVKIHLDDKHIDGEAIEGIVKQHPNRRLMGIFRFHLWIYNSVSRKKDKRETKFRSWLKNTVGEPPVILDDALTKKTSIQVSRYLENKGYFNNHISDSTFYKGKKATVHYFIKPGSPYTIRRFSFAISDTSLVKPIKICSKKSLVLQGNHYDEDILAMDRERLSHQMRNLGYYRFSKEYIQFRIDSTLGNHKLDVKMDIDDPVIKVKSPTGTDTLINGKHELYYIRDIYINTAYDARNSSSAVADTLHIDEYHFLNPARLRYKPEVILRNIFISGSDFYREERVDYTQKRLSALRTFKFTNITFRQVDAEDGENMLDCYINMIPTPSQSITLETQGTNRSGDLGISGNVSFRNKNTFRGAEVLEINLMGGMEVQTIQNAASADVSGTSGIAQQLNADIPFNTLELGADASLSVPRFVLPFHIKFLPTFYDPKTNIRLSYSFQQRPDYSRNIATISYG
ncbi:MAG: hypothetical protein ACE5DN_04720, partial [Flavobacteriales bacterium]